MSKTLRIKTMAIFELKTLKNPISKFSTISPEILAMDSYSKIASHWTNQRIFEDRWSRVCIVKRQGTFYLGSFKSIQNEDQQVTPYFYLGKSYFRKNEFKNAINYLENVNEIIARKKLRIVIKKKDMNYYTNPIKPQEILKMQIEILIIISNQIKKQTVLI